jgi:hypothetical protein
MALETLSAGGSWSLSLLQAWLAQAIGQEGEKDNP